MSRLQGVCNALTGYTCTVEELMAVIVSREIKDQEKVSVGTLSPLPAAACWLAQASHAPGLQLQVLGSASVGRTDFFDHIQRGKCDLFFLSGAQIDRKANLNLHFIGSADSPKVRLPGGAGSGMIYTMARRTILFLGKHSTRNLVEKVDFITSAGGAQAGFLRRGFPSCLVTPLCLFRFDREKEQLYPASLHPGVTLQELKLSTGWSLPDAELPETVLPTEAELQLLRGKVKAKMVELYPVFAENKIR